MSVTSPDAVGVATTVRYLWFGGRNTLGVTLTDKRRSLAETDDHRVVIGRPERRRARTGC